MQNKSKQLPLLVVACRMRDMATEVLASGKQIDSYGLSRENTVCDCCLGRDNVYNMAVVNRGEVESTFKFCGHCCLAYDFNILVRVTK